MLYIFSNYNIYRFIIPLVSFGGAILFYGTPSYCLQQNQSKSTSHELVVNTWGFTNATRTGWEAMQRSNAALDAIEMGCMQCEIEQCDGTVGYGGSPDESGETTLDAMIMDGPSHDVGAVGGLRRVKQAISVARAVMTHTKHTMLVGDAATKFAVDMGFTETNLTTMKSRLIYENWKKANCQPNFRQNVLPEPTKSCGPYKPSQPQIPSKAKARINNHVSKYNHDTIGMIAIDSKGRIAGGTSTNGATHKVPGRVGDSPIAGAGVYVEQGVGGAAATGDGDVMMRFLPSYHTVMLMSSGWSPEAAATAAIAKITKKYPEFNGAIVAADMNGKVGAACHGFSHFPYSYRDSNEDKVQTITVTCSRSV